MVISKNKYVQYGKTNIKILSHFSEIITYLMDCKNISHVKNSYFDYDLWILPIFGDIVL